MGTQQDTKKSGNSSWLPEAEASVQRGRMAMMLKTKGWDSGCLAVLGCPACHLLPGWLPASLSRQVSRSSYHRCGSGNTLLQGPTQCEQEAPCFPSPAPLSPLVTAGLVQLNGPICSCACVTHLVTCQAVKPPILVCCITPLVISWVF